MERHDGDRLRGGAGLDEGILAGDDADRCEDVGGVARQAMGHAAPVGEAAGVYGLLVEGCPRRHVLDDRPDESDVLGRSIRGRLPIPRGDVAARLGLGDHEAGDVGELPHLAHVVVTLRIRPESVQVDHERARFRRCRRRRIQNVAAIDSIDRECQVLDASGELGRQGRRGDRGTDARRGSSRWRRRGSNICRDGCGVAARAGSGDEGNRHPPPSPATSSQRTPPRTPPATACR